MLTELISQPSRYDKYSKYIELRQEGTLQCGFDKTEQGARCGKAFANYNDILTHIVGPEVHIEQTTTDSFIITPCCFPQGRRTL